MALHIFIPARYGSSRFPGKPLVNIDGKPMIQHVMERAMRARGVSSVAAATDDERIAEAVRNFGGEAIMTGGELRSGSDRVAQAAELKGIGPDELVANVQGDQPLLQPKVIETCARPFTEDPEVVMTTPVTPIVRPEEVTDPNHVKVVMAVNKDALYFSRQPIPHPRDGEEVTYYKHLGIYLFRMSFLKRFAAMPTGRLESIEKLEQIRVLEAGAKVRCVVTDKDSPEVDRPQDAERVAELLSQDRKA